MAIDYGKFQFEVTCEATFTDAELAERMRKAQESASQSLASLAERFSLAVDAAAYALMMAGHKGLCAWPDHDAPNTTVHLVIGEARACTIALVPCGIDLSDGKLEVDVVTTWHSPFEGMTKESL